MNTLDTVENTLQSTLCVCIGQVWSFWWTSHKSNYWSEHWDCGADQQAASMIHILIIRDLWQLRWNAALEWPVWGIDFLPRPPLNSRFLLFSCTCSSPAYEYSSSAPVITAGLAPIVFSTTFRHFRFSVLIDIKPLILLVAAFTTAFLLTASSVSLLVWALFLKWSVDPHLKHLRPWEFLPFLSICSWLM